ncbi:hypothetical protein PR048_007336 [Dryococelus australis]|uniref:Uncharacterized protein n=1 Tax=Dryococelus australis TaxID=614101 RepID=A0ABQ9IDC3_9NEOP|nr:hypothetical protein PR048_007336 [Dryococelus australis]
MHRLCLAWSRLKPSTIANCFARQDFLQANDETDCNDETDECESEWVEVQSKFDSGELSFSDFASVDTQLATCSLESDETHVEENIQVNNGSGDEYDSDEVEIKCPQQEEVYSALDALERLFMTSTICLTPWQCYKVWRGL